MAVIAIHQDDIRPLLAPQGVTEAGSQLQTAGATADNNNFLQS
jgi:hypothetical protein